MLAKTTNKYPALQWLVKSLSKIQFFSKLGVVFWSLIILAQQSVYFYQVASIMLPYYNFPMKVIWMSMFTINAAYFVLCPWSVFLIDHCTGGLLKSKDIQAPRYWYLLLLAKLLAPLYVILNTYNAWPRVEWLILLDYVLSPMLDLISCLILGIATATLASRCSQHVSNGSLVQKAKGLHALYKTLKSGSQLGMFNVFVFRTSYMIFYVSYVIFM